MQYANKKGYIKPPVNPHNEPLVDGLNSLLESLHDNDDRSLVLNLAAFAEDTLELLLVAYLREGSQAKELINGFNAPLGTFSARIKAAFVLGLILQDGYKTLETLRKIRNKFAHNWDGVSLDRDDVRNLVNSLSRSRVEEISESPSGTSLGFERDRLLNKISDVLIDLRLLAKALIREGVKVPLIAQEVKPVRVRFELVDRLPDEGV